MRAGLAGKALAAKVLAAAVLAAGGAGLSSCGFTPLYAQQGATSNLAAVEVVAPEGRAGYLLREHLDDAFGRNLDAAPAYKMHLVVHESRYPRGVRIDNVATRYEYVMTASYVLNAVPSGAVAKRGVVKVELTYDSADQPYSAIAAQQDAEDRAADEAARKIQLEVAAWLATGAKSAT
jgi:LPS-assembly lipoprotein